MSNNQRQSALCPVCRKLISSKEVICPYCHASVKQSWFKKSARIVSSEDPFKLINYIIFINVFMYVLSLCLNLSEMSFSMNPLTALSPATNSLFLLGATGTLPIDRLGNWWSLITASFLHGGLLHLIFNMLALRQIGYLVIREYGPYRMILIYTLTGVAGYFLSYLAGVQLTIGASASVCGLIGAALYFGKSRGGVYGLAVYRQTSGWVFSLFLFGLLIPNINNWGHGGGLFAGILLGFFLGYAERARESQLQISGAIVCIALTVITLAWSVFYGLMYAFS